MIAADFRQVSVEIGIVDQVERIDDDAHEDARADHVQLRFHHRPVAFELAQFDLRLVGADVVAVENDGRSCGIGARQQCGR
ncbi:hypothetical protein D3C71_1938790 [compost metagenome]